MSRFRNCRTKISHGDIFFPAASSLGPCHFQTGLSLLLGQALAIGSQDLQDFIAAQSMEQR